MTELKIRHSVISLFAGCGGLDLGIKGGFISLGKQYKKNPFDIIWANDIDKHACMTYIKNFGEESIECSDIWKILDEGTLPESADVVLGGFPCQDFSHAGKRKGFDSERGNLYKAMIEVIRQTRPKIFLAENVKGLLTMNQGGAIRKIIEDFKDIGYNVDYQLMLAADYGVPQMRERVIIIGTARGLDGQFTFPKPTHTHQTWITVKDAIIDLIQKKEGSFPNHFWSKAKRNKGQGNNPIDPNRPGPTMRSEHHGNIEFLWDESRRLSAREAARIQSFPDDFIFLPSTSAAYKQIGNAIAPVFGWHLAQSLEKFLGSSQKYDI